MASVFPMLRAQCQGRSPALLLALILAPRLSSSSQLHRRWGAGGCVCFFFYSCGAKAGQGQRQLVSSCEGLLAVGSVLAESSWDRRRYCALAPASRYHPATRPMLALLNLSSICFSSRGPWTISLQQPYCCQLHAWRCPPPAGPSASPLHPVLECCAVQRGVARGLHLVHVVALLNGLEDGCKIGQAWQQCMGATFDLRHGSANRRQLPSGADQTRCRCCNI